MKRQFLAVVAVLASSVALVIAVHLLGSAKCGSSELALAAPLDLAVTDVEPASAHNDLDTSIIITGTGFVSTPMAYLGDTPLDDVIWVSTTTLEATVPWGMDPGVYTLTVTNPDSESGSLPGALTVTQGIGVWTAGTLYGGSVEQIVVNPGAPTVLYAASESVGLFRSQDGADHWSYIASGTNVRALAIDPNSPETLYVSMSGQGSAGLHRSDDGGDTWTPLNAPGDIPFPHPTDTGTLFVSNRWEGESGLWKSTDYGQTWLTKTSGLTDTRVNNLVFDPTDPLTIYVGTELGNLFVSSDGGDNWSFVDRPADLIQVLAINPRGAHELWVSNACFSTTKETLKSTNADHTAWTQVADPVGSNSIGTIVFAPQAWGDDIYSDTVFVSSCWGQAHRSDDGGNSWSQFGPTTGEWGVALHPSDLSVAYRSSEWDGVIRSTDGGANWQVVNNGLTALVPHRLEAVPGEPGTLYAITERPDGIYKSTHGGETWQFLTIPGAWGIESVLVDPSTPTRVYAGRGDPQDRVLVHISEDGGATWPITSAITVTGPYTGCPNFVNALVGDSSPTGTLLLGMEHFCMGVPGIHTGDLYHSSKAGLSWTLATISGTDTISPVTTIAYDTLISTTVYAATGLWNSGSGLLRSVNGGEDWEPIGTGIPALDCVEHLAVEPGGDHRVFAQACEEGLYVSYNHGISWTEAIPWSNGGWVNDMLCTDNESMLYAATGNGLYRMVKSEETGVMWWEPAAGLLGQIPVYSLATVTATDRVILYVGTTGGYAGSGAAQALSRANNDGILVNAGVYRYTTRRIWRVYLPLVLKAYAP